MAQLRIERGGHRVAFLSKFRISVDGEEVAKLKHGESTALDVSPGKHTLHAHATGLTDGSTEIEIPDGGSDLIVGSKTSIRGAASEAVSSGTGSKLQIEFWAADSPE